MLAIQRARSGPALSAQHAGTWPQAIRRRWHGPGTHLVCAACLIMAVLVLLSGWCVPGSYEPRPLVLERQRTGVKGPVRGRLEW